MARYLWLRQIQGEMATRLDTSRRVGPYVLEFSCAVPGPGNETKQDHESEVQTAVYCATRAGFTNGPSLEEHIIVRGRTPELEPAFDGTN